MKSKTVNKKGRIAQTYTVPTVFWIITGLAILLIFSMHIYGDLLITAKQGKFFWNCLFAGKPMSFYKEAQVYLDYPYEGRLYRTGYPFSIYLLFALWELPVWILERITQNDLFNTFANKLWLKAFLMLFVILCTQQMYRITSRIDSIKDKAHLSAYLFLTSIFMLTSTGIASQYDIVALFFILLGFEAWVCDRMKSFFVWFMLAVPFKYFALIFFIPLLLIKEKKIIKILAYGIFSLLPTLILWFIFPKPENQLNNVGNLFVRFTTGTLNLGKAYIVPFFAVMLAVCLWAYFFNSKDAVRDGVFAMLIVSGAFCFLAGTYPYWTVLGAPMFVLAVFLSNGNVNKALWCETVMCACLTAINTLKYYWAFSSKTLAAMGSFSYIFKVPVTTLGAVDFGLGSLLSRIGDTGVNMLYTVLICTWVFFIVLCRPKQKKIERLEPLSYWSIALRTVANIGIAALPMLTNIAYFVIFKR